MNASRLVSAALLVFATSLPAQTCVWNSERYRERDVVPLTPEERARCLKALAEIESHRAENLPALIEDLVLQQQFVFDSFVLCQPSLAMRFPGDAVALLVVLHQFHRPLQRQLGMRQRRFEQPHDLIQRQQLATG